MIHNSSLDNTRRIAGFGTVAGGRKPETTGNQKVEVVDDYVVPDIEYLSGDEKEIVDWSVDVFNEEVKKREVNKKSETNEVGETL